MPSSQTGVLNIVMKVEPPSNLTKALLMSMYSANTGMRNNINISLPYNSPMSGFTQSIINLSLRGPYMDTLSSVLPLTISGASYLTQSIVNMYLKSDFLGFLTGCFVEEASPISIELEDLSDCLGIAGRGLNGFDMFMKSDGTGITTSSPLNMTIKYNPANIIMMTLKASGTQTTNTATVFMKASSTQTNIIDMTLPVVHAVVTKPIMFSTRGF